METELIKYIGFYMVCTCMYLLIFIMVDMFWYPLEKEIDLLNYTKLIFIIDPNFYVLCSYVVKT